MRSRKFRARNPRGADKSGRIAGRASCPPALSLNYCDLPKPIEIVSSGTSPYALGESSAVEKLIDGLGADLAGSVSITESLHQTIKTDPTRLELPISSMRATRSFKFTIELTNHFVDGARDVAQEPIAVG